MVLIVVIGSQEGTVFGSSSRSERRFSDYRRDLRVLYVFQGTTLFGMRVSTLSEIPTFLVGEDVRESPFRSVICSLQTSQRVTDSSLVITTITKEVSQVVIRLDHLFGRVLLEVGTIFLFSLEG